MVHDPFTLVVALDAAGKAEGDLYLDDGHSFAFTQGTYLHRRWVAGLCDLQCFFVFQQSEYLASPAII
jgi:hypothetical protein